MRTMQKSPRKGLSRPSALNLDCAAACRLRRRSSKSTRPAPWCLQSAPSLAPPVIGCAANQSFSVSRQCVKNPEICVSKERSRKHKHSPRLDVEVIGPGLCSKSADDATDANLQNCFESANDLCGTGLKNHSANASHCNSISINAYCLQQNRADSRHCSRCSSIGHTRFAFIGFKINCFTPALQVLRRSERQSDQMGPASIGRPDQPSVCASRHHCACTGAICASPAARVAARSSARACIG